MMRKIRNFKVTINQMSSFSTSRNVLELKKKKRFHPSCSHSEHTTKVHIELARVPVPYSLCKNEKRMFVLLIRQSFSTLRQNRPR